MVQQLRRSSTPRVSFPVTAPAANPVFFRTYSRQKEEGRESWDEMCDRTVAGVAKLGKLTSPEEALIARMQREVKALTSGRWLWIGGTEWIDQQKNFSGGYNCTSTNVVDWRAFALMMDLAMMGCGTGAMLEPKYISQLPAVRNTISLKVQGDLGATPALKRREETEVNVTGNQIFVNVGDSRQGWVKSYEAVLEASSDERFDGEVEIIIDMSDVRPAGEILKGFGGMANPVKLPDMYSRVARILNKAKGRQLDSIECCLLIDEAAVTIVAGNIRRSAGMRQFDSNDSVATGAKENLWRQDADGNWSIDPERDALRMANHTRVFHRKPTKEETFEAVQKQFFSGEGAIQYAPEAIARASADLLTTPELKSEFLGVYNELGAEEAKGWLKQYKPEMSDEELEHRFQRYGLNPCGEIIGANFHCNLSEIHLNRLDPKNPEEQDDAFRAGALSVAALLNHEFLEERYRKSRELDPIVGVSFTGFFDFCVHAFGTPWLNWWEEGRPETAQGKEFKAQEEAFLSRWRKVVHETIWDYCDRHNLHRPNRCTTVQPAGTKSLLTGASSGWHPPKAQRFIRRITFRKNDPVAMACIDYGYSVVPSQSDKDEKGNLLDNPFDPRCTEWLVEIPTEVSWANLPGADTVDISQFSALAQFDFYMQVQKHYTRHNTSATVELREGEVTGLAERIHECIQNDEGYMSVALLARFDDLQTFPRLPFEPIDKATYEELVAGVEKRRDTADFLTALKRYDLQPLSEAGPAGCDSDKCLMPEKKPD